MRLLRLGLDAYGPFTNTTLELTGPKTGGLHVIFGQNEAGKSTALRAVSNLLFGMGERTPDAHMHPTRELKLSALLEDDARQLACMRRKRRKDSLRNPNDEPLPEAALAPFLHGVDRTLFHTLFGLDHERLKLGGQALLSGEGDIGQSLFDAGTGGRGSHQLLLELGLECDELFKTRASKPSLNRALGAYRDAKKQARDEVRLPEKYLEQLGQVERAKETRQALTVRRAELKQELERLERVLVMQPIVARRRQCLEELARLGEVPPLPDDAARLRADAQKTLLECERDIMRTERDLRRRRQEHALLPVAVALAELPKHLIDELRDKVGIHRKAQRDLPNVRGQIKQTEAEAQRILLGIGRPLELEAAEGLRLGTARIAQVRRLAREGVVLAQKHQSAEERRQSAELELGSCRRRLELMGQAAELAPLEQALRQARRADELEARQGQAQKTLVPLEKRVSELERGLFTSAGAPGPAELTPVEPETIERYRERFAKLEADLEQARAELGRGEAELFEAERHIDGIQRQGPVPSEEQLHAIRSERSQSFERLLEAESGANASEVKLYRELVSGADEVADRLRREAVRVAELAQWQAARAHSERWLDRERERLGQFEQEQLALSAVWRALWRGVPTEAKTPSEMLGWRRRFDEWRRGKFERGELLRELAELEEELAAQRLAFEKLLLEPGVSSSETLGELLERAREEFEHRRQHERERQALEVSVRQLEAVVEREALGLAASLTPLARWEEAWREAVAPLGLGESPAPDEALAVLEEIVELVRKLDELPHNRRRVAGMERDAKAFAAALEPLLGVHARDLEGLPVDEAAERLAERYQAAVSQALERRRLSDEIAGLEHEQAEHLLKKASAERDLEALLGRVGAKDVADLERIEQRHRQRLELEERQRELADQLLAQGGGPSIEILVKEAGAVERATLVVRREELRLELEDTESAWRDEEVNIDRLERGLEYYGDEAAAEAAQVLEERAAEARELLERYLRLRLGKTMLEREIARYRERHQGPVLSRASELFRCLTLAGYQGLSVGLEERTLRCVRAQGDEVSVGQLSEGTQYQLYLALRLATLEHYLETSAPVPLVFDDLLIHFDDERARAAFRVLGELAGRVQILYFTHLARDLELSESAVDPSLLRHHRLDPSRTLRPSRSAIDPRYS